METLERYRREYECMPPTGVYSTPLASLIRLEGERENMGGARLRVNLSSSDIKAIRENPERLSQTELSRMYGISQPMVSRIVSREAFREVA